MSQKLLLIHEHINNLKEYLDHVLFYEEVKMNEQDDMMIKKIQTADLARDYATLKTALLTISQEIVCEGPNCIYCENDNHPFSRAAKTAQETLSRVKY